MLTGAVGVSVNQPIRLVRPDHSGYFRRGNIHDVFSLVGISRLALFSQAARKCPALIERSREYASLPFWRPKRTPGNLIFCVIDAKGVSMSEEGVRIQQKWIVDELDTRAIGKLLADEKVSIAMHEIHRATARRATEYLM